MPAEPARSATTAHLPVALIVITLNEEKTLARCLASVPFASEVLVIDSGSTDNTLHIARAAGATVVSQSWLGFGAQRNVALSRCTSPWVMYLDADEWLSDGAVSDLVRLFDSGEIDAYDGVIMPRTTIFCGVRMRHYAGHARDGKLRLCRRDRGRWNDAPIHEALECSGPLYRLDSEFFHELADGFDEYAHKTVRYASAKSRAKYVDGTPPSAWRLIARVAWRLLRNLLLRGAVFDGKVGIALAQMDVFHDFLLEALRLGRGGPLPGEAIAVPPTPAVASSPDAAAPMAERAGGIAVASSCPVCRTAYPNDPGDLPDAFRRCPHCGSLAQTVMPTDEQQAALYSGHYSGVYLQKSRAKLLRAKRWIGRVRRLGHEGGRWLDVGCSVGTVLEVASNAGYQTFGIDVDAGALEHARRRAHTAQLECGPLEGSAFPAAFFDVISVYDVIEHSRQPRAFVRELRRILKPGGIVHVRTPRVDHWRVPSTVSTWEHFKPGEHVCLFTLRGLDELMQQSRLEPLNVRLHVKPIIDALYRG